MVNKKLVIKSFSANILLAATQLLKLNEKELEGKLKIVSKLIKGYKIKEN